MYRKVPNTYRFGATFGWGSRTYPLPVIGAPRYHFDHMLHTAEENINKLEGIAIRTIQHETQK